MIAYSVSYAPPRRVGFASLLLQFIQDAPRLPVQRYPQDFVNFIKTHNVTLGGDVWSAYPEQTVLDIHRLVGSS